MTQKQTYGYHLLRLIFLSGVIAFVCPVDAIAQRIPIADDTLGNERSIVSSDEVINGRPSNRINGGARRGANLFHSFQEFNIDEGRGVYFTNPEGVANILARVTGGTRSDILGTLGVDGSANLFLLNPNGILFGPNSQLNIRGSFLASTANRFQFSDGSEFSAINPQAPPLLTINVPLGLQSGTIPVGSVITNRGNLMTGQDLVLESDRLDLQGQLVSGQDLTLLATDTVTARDSVTTPFVAAAGNNLLVQGNQGIDVFAVNHPNSGLFTSGNLVLRSDQTVSGDAHFWVGSNFRIERLDGSLGNLFSPYDPIMLTNGNVELGNYTGASLHILAGGSVTLGNVTITGTGDTATTINPNNTTLFNGNRTYADLATFNLTEYQATLNSNGAVRSVAPVAVPITIDGSTQATLDIRAGIDWASLGGLLTFPTITGTITPPPNNSTATPSRADITINGTPAFDAIGTPVLNAIRVSQPGGLVLLTNQFRSNALPGTISIGGGINVSTNISQSNGGDIWVYGRGDITVSAADRPSNRIYLDASSSSSLGLGNGGTISLSTNSGNISLSNEGGLDAFAFAFAPSNLGSGSGGTISLSTNSGNISLNRAGVSVNSRSFGFSNSSTAGNAGTISFVTNSGDISLTNSRLILESRAYTGNTGNGGALSFTTNSGDISLTNSRTTSFSSSSNTAGNGGTISVATNSGNITALRFSDWDSSSLSGYVESGGKGGNGGAISVATNSGNITLSASSSFSNSFSNSGMSGNAGEISMVTQSGDIFFEGNAFENDMLLSSNSFSNLGTAGNGGGISIITHFGNISLTNLEGSSFSFSRSGNAGNGGAIRLSAEDGTISGRSTLLNSVSVSQTGGSSNGGQVTLEAGREVSGLEITTVASGGLSGRVELNGFGNLEVANTRILTAQQLQLRDPRDRSRTISINLSDKGQAGDVTVSSTGSLMFSHSMIESDTRGVNPAGNVTFRANRGIIIDDSNIAARTNSNGDAGDISFQADQGITITGSSTISAITSGSGAAGNITFTTPNFLVVGGARVLADTTSIGNGGSIVVNAPTSVNLRRTDGASPVLSVETSGAGEAGDISINTPNLTLAEQARITATATATATNPQGGGSVTINASNLNLAGTVGVFAETQSASSAGTLTLQPDRNRPNLNIDLSGGARISASTSSSGRGGDLFVTAPEAIAIQGNGRLSVETTGTGIAGNIDITAPRLTIADRAIVSASTSNTGQGGNLSVNAPVSVLLNNRGGLLTESTGRGRAGNLNINTPQLTLQQGAEISASNRSSAGGDVQIRGLNLLSLDRSSITASTQEGQGGSLQITTREGGQVALNHHSRLAAEATNGGDAGSLTINNVDRLTLQGRSSATVSSREGRAGDLSINAASVVLDDGTLEAIAGAGNGGNITLSASGRLLQLSNHSQISAQARNNANGGNVTIQVPNGFVVANPFENSDILANAEGRGNGGNINITTQTIFGLAERNPLSPFSDINASSQFGLNGAIALNTLAIDPTRGLATLPENVASPDQISQQCAVGSGGTDAQGAFIITGRGGLPPTPREAVNQDAIQVDLVTANIDDESFDSQQALDQNALSSELPIVEAQGWQVAATGEVMLVATVPQRAIAPSSHRLTHCHP